MDYKEKRPLVTNQSFFSAIVENSSDLISVIDKTGQYQYVGQSVYRLLGFTPEELVGTNALLYIHAEDLPPVLEILTAITAEENTRMVTFRFKAKTGEWRWLECQLTSMLNNSSIRGIVTNSKDITAQREAQIKEEKARVYYQTLFQDYPDAVVTLATTGMVLNANSIFQQLSGYSLAEVIDRHFTEFVPVLYQEHAISALQRVLQGEIQTIETRLIQKKGQFLDLQVTGVPILLNGNPEGVQCVIKDITAKKKVEAQLELLSLVASKTTNGVIITDKYFKIEWVNASFTSLTGYSLAEIMGKSPGNLLQGSSTNPDTVLLLREKLAKAESVSVEILNYKKTGEEVWFAMEINPIFNEAGETYKFVATQIDITSRKKAELELRKLTKDLYDHNRDLKQFTYIVSHNLRAPVATALGLANLLTLVDKNHEIFATSLQNLQITVEQLNTILKDLNAILSIRNNQDTVDKEKFAVTEVYQQAVTNLQDALAGCGGKVSLRVTGDDVLLTKKAYLYSIFYNLLSNAIKYRSPERPLHVEVSYQNQPETGKVITFADNGTGLDLSKVGEDLFKLYKRFHRNIEGRGMGLFLVKTHVEALGGRIEVNSKVNEGTTFVIYLP